MLDTLLRGMPYRPATNETQVFDGLGDGFLAAYLWLERQLTVRLGPPPAGGRFPVWAYADPRDARADWRRGEHEQPAAVKLQLQLPEARMARSGLYTWSDAAAGLDLRLQESGVERFFEELEAVAATLPPPVWNGQNLERPDLHSPWLLAHLSGYGVPEAMVRLLTPIIESWENIFDVGFCRSYRQGEVVQASFWEIRPEDLIASRSYPARQAALTSVPPQIKDSHAELVQ